MIHIKNRFLLRAGEISSEDKRILVEEINEYKRRTKNIGILARHKPHLLIPKIYQLCTSSIIKQAVESFLNSEAFLWYSVFFYKPSHSNSYVPWHYDDYFWAHTGTGCTVWLAIDNVTEDMGPMEFCDAPIDNYNHGVNTDRNNLLARGNFSNFAPNEKDNIYKVLLKQGEFSIHSNYVWHRSVPNLSPNDRMGVALRYLTKNGIPQKLRFIKRGVVGASFDKKYFFKDSPPKGISVPLGNSSHFFSVLYSSLVSAFGDPQRNFVEQIIDLAKFSLTRITGLIKR